MAEQVVLHSDRHLRMAQRIVGDRGLAEDVCQQAYLKAMGARDQVRDAGKLSAWINRVVTNEALDVLRRRKTQRRIYEARGERGDEPLSGEATAQESEARDQMIDLLARLNDPIREVVVMRTMQGMTGQEVKEVLGCSAALVSKRLHRGLEQLRQWINEAQQEEAVTR